MAAAEPGLDDSQVVTPQDFLHVLQTVEAPGAAVKQALFNDITSELVMLPVVDRAPLHMCPRM